ncbi:hypothetical protein [Acinetobacter sp.]|uniref:hypothetical protein n=1 Tax=Acinetobacter sp. TaxID=472 RepID=UPI00257DEED0|nr:hypothetical protein [Acinetobacter sp.]
MKKNSFSTNDAMKRKKFLYAWLYLLDRFLDYYNIKKYENISKVDQYITNDLTNFDLIYKGTYVKNENFFLSKFFSILDYFVPVNFYNIKLNSTELGNGFTKYINLFKYYFFLFKLTKLEDKEAFNKKIKFISLFKDIDGFDYNLLSVIPNIFFSKLIFNNQTLKIYGCGFDIFRYPFFNIYFYKNFRFTSLIHGGGYYEWSDNEGEIIEYYVSDNWPKWSETIKKSFPNKNKSFKNLILALRAPVSRSGNFEIFHSSLKYHLENDHNNASSLLELASVLNIKVKKHPVGRNLQYPEEIYKNLKTVTEINNNDLVIFDSLSSSLAIACIKKQIPFIYILDEIKYKKLTSHHERYLKKLIKNKILFIESDPKKLKSLLEDLLINKNANIQKIIKLNSELLKIANEVNDYKKDYTKMSQTLILPENIIL